MLFVDMFLQLYASPVKVAGTKLNKSIPKPKEPQPDIDDIYAGVEPPPLPKCPAYLSEDIERFDPLPPPPPRISYVNTIVVFSPLKIEGLIFILSLSFHSPSLHVYFDVS